MTVLGCAALWALTGCAPAPGPSACPAVGWLNLLTVELAGDSSDAATVQICTDEGCAPGEDVGSTSALKLIALTHRAGNTWTFSTDMLVLETATIRVLAADRSVVSETPVTPEWKRVGGSEQCGGPSIGSVSVVL